MDNTPHPENNICGNINVKQSFLSNAISDISTYIQMADTKVSIIMAAIVAFIVGVFSCHESIAELISKIKPCSWLGVSLIIVGFVHILSLIGVFLFGILTIRSHSSNIGYKSKWFLPQSTSEYSFDAFKEDILIMDDKDIIENMAAELYKLNDINRQKLKTCKGTLICFSASLITAFIICVLLLLAKK